MADYDIAYTLLAGMSAVQVGRLLASADALREFLGTHRLDLSDEDIEDPRDYFRA